MKKSKSKSKKKISRKIASKVAGRKTAGRKESPIIPGELLIDKGEIVLNAGRKTVSLQVANSGDRPIQVGSHYHFYETNTALEFDREASRGYRLNIPAGTAVRFEPGQTRKIELVEYAGARQVYGFNAKIMGSLE